MATFGGRSRRAQSPARLGHVVSDIHLPLDSSKLSFREYLYPSRLHGHALASTLWLCKYVYQHCTASYCVLPSANTSTTARC